MPQEEAAGEVRVATSRQSGPTGRRRSRAGARQSGPPAREKAGIICVIRRLESVIGMYFACSHPPKSVIWRIVDATLPGQSLSAGRAVIWRAVEARITRVRWET